MRQSALPCPLPLPPCLFSLPARRFCHPRSCLSADRLLVPTPTPRITPPREGLQLVRQGLGVATLPEVNTMACNSCLCVLRCMCSQGWQRYVVSITPHSPTHPRAHPLPHQNQPVPPLTLCPAHPTMRAHNTHSLTHAPSPLPPSGPAGPAHLCVQAGGEHQEGGQRAGTAAR